jgi:hypothetical protein
VNDDFVAFDVSFWTFKVESLTLRRVGLQLAQSRATDESIDSYDLPATATLDCQRHVARSFRSSPQRVNSITWYLLVEAVGDTTEKLEKRRGAAYVRDLADLC